MARLLAVWVTCAFCRRIGADPRYGAASRCPACGVNLNTGHCECVAEPADGRLAVLARLLSSADDEDGRADNRADRAYKE